MLERSHRRVGSQMRTEVSVKGENQKVSSEVRGFVLILVGACNAGKAVMPFMLCYSQQQQ